MEKISKDIVRSIINNNFEWKDVSKKYKDIETFGQNVFCPFHDHNFTEGNAKFYFNEDSGLWTLYCFVEKKTFDVYSFVSKVLCESWQKYKSPLDFLLTNMSREDLASQIGYFKNKSTEQTENTVQMKINYINNTISKYENVIDYIEELYTA